METAPPGNKALATPAVRHLAKKHGIDINMVPGTGKDGRVTKEDMLPFVSGEAQASFESVQKALEQQAPAVGRQVPRSKVVINVAEGD